MQDSIVFKEWQVVCDALASGRQTLLLRKGGIHEGRDGFSFAHSSFYLFPTRFHALGDQVREGEVKVLPEWQPGDEIVITHHAQASWAITLTDWDQVAALEPKHIYSQATVRDRFDWEGKGMASGSIHVALVRVRELAKPWVFPYEKGHGGCRSWVNIPGAPSIADARPVLDDIAYASAKAEIEALIGR
ncbi:MAG TPA: DUF1802 family protein [Luteolibacter sp.]|nr:DUF1802 family protein [Luteolibacter sp.]